MQAKRIVIDQVIVDAFENLVSTDEIQREHGPEHVIAGHVCSY